jgi:periplasmic protein TonB
MFEDSLLQSHNGQQRRTWATTLSFVIELVLMSVAVLAPLLYTEALPSHILNTTVEAPAPPPPPARPFTSRAALHHQGQSEINDGQVMMPQVIPRVVKEIHDEAVGAESSRDGVEGAVPGLPTNSAGDRLLANMLHAIPAAIPKAAAPRAVRVSSGVAEGLLIRQVRPQYPAPARAARIQGAVMLQATIGKDGAIQDLRLLSGHPLLAQAAIEAVRQWRYRPYRLNDEAVEVDTTIRVNFTLGGANW